LSETKVLRPHAARPGNRPQTGVDDARNALSVRPERQPESAHLRRQARTDRKEY